MKRLLILTVAVLIASCGAVRAQNCIVVDSEKIFKSIGAYNQAVTTLDALAESYQKQVDAQFALVEQNYNRYMAEKESLTPSAQHAREEAILKQEREATEFQESIFGQEGELIKKRKELIQPIQKQVFDAIDRYAKANGIDIVIDKASNPTLLFSADRADRTQEVIRMLQ